MIWFTLVSLSVFTIVAVCVFMFTKFDPLPFIAAIFVGTLLSVGTYAVGFNVAQNEAQTYNEYWDGFETGVVTDVTECNRDGSCVNEYQCDPYTVMESETYYDSDGKSHTRMVTKTKYHDCPYSTEETSFFISTTIGDFTAASHLMTGSEWRAGSGRLVSAASAPASWTAVKERLAAGNPGAVTAVHEYKNFLLASEVTLFKKYEGNMNDLLSNKLLPTPAAGVQNMYSAPKAYFVGGVGKKVDSNALTESVAKLGGAIGHDLQGDLHVVFVPADKVGSPTDYTNSLMAYWQSKELKRNTVAKNSIIVVVGVDSNGVIKGSLDGEPEKGVAASWVKASTGMPVGNEAMLTEIESTLTGVQIDENFIGNPKYNVANSKVVHSDGILESVIFGSNTFERVSMSANDEGDKGSGFEYLKAEYKLSGGALAIIIVIAFLLSASVLAIATYIGYNSHNRATRNILETIFSKSTNKIKV